MVSIKASLTVVDLLNPDLVSEVALETTFNFSWSSLGIGSGVTGIREDLRTFRMLQRVDYYNPPWTL